MGKSDNQAKKEKILSKKLEFNRIDIQFNDKSIVIEYVTPKKAVEHAIAFLFRVIEYFKFTGSIINLGSDKYKSIDIQKYFAHPMLRSELFNIEKNLLLYGGTIKYGGRVYIEISPSPIYKGRLVILTKTAWKKDDVSNTLDSLSNSFKLKTPTKITKRLMELIDEKIDLDNKIREEQREEFLQKRKEELEHKIETEKKKLAELEEKERMKQEAEKLEVMKKWRIKNRLFPIADLPSINWDKRWMEDFDMITSSLSNVKIESLDDEEFLRQYCDQVIDFILHLDVYMIKQDPEIKNMMIRQIHASKKEAIYKVMEPEPEIDDNIEIRLQQLIRKLPQTPDVSVIQPKPVPIEEEESEKKAKEKEQKEIPLFD